MVKIGQSSTKLRLLSWWFPSLYTRGHIPMGACVHPSVINDHHLSWWRHQMETFSALLALCAGNSPVPVNSPHKGQWRGALMFSLICARINDWVNNREAGDLRRHLGHYDVNVMWSLHKGYLRRLPQHTQQIDPMKPVPQSNVSFELYQLRSPTIASGVSHNKNEITLNICASPAFESYLFGKNVLLTLVNSDGHVWGVYYINWSLGNFSLV